MSDNSKYYIAPGIYRHYKGGEYEVLFMAKNSETLEDMVIYRALYGGHDVWARPAHMWNETVKIGETTVRRFEKIKQATVDEV